MFVCFFLQIQLEAFHSRIGDIVKIASLCGVNVICFQEAWSKFDLSVKWQIGDYINHWLLGSCMHRHLVYVTNEEKYINLKF